MSERPNPPAGKQVAQSRREKRLAEALRANLKRRKEALKAASDAPGSAKDPPK